MMDEINAAIAQLMAQEQLNSNAPTSVGRPEQELIAEHEALLSRRHGPTSWGAVVIFMSFALWVGSLFWMIWHGVRKDGALNRLPLLRGGLASVSLFACFCWALIAL